MFKHTITHAGDRPVVLMDSISSVAEADAGSIVVSASHGGVSSGEFATRHVLGACFFNDAGVGKDRAGIAALAMLQEIGVAGATLSHDTACIGDARDHWEYGVVSHVNEVAAAAGVEPGQPVQSAVARLGA
ncbi:MAG TPA: hypothetical protein VK506_14015 [Conexibacter sp.]|nr:hypothetical protein [Conexibacter sp.]